MIVVLRQLVLEDEDYACEAMELFDELLECEVAILAPHIASVVSFLLEVGNIHACMYVWCGLYIRMPFSTAVAVAAYPYSMCASCISELSLSQPPPPCRWLVAHHSLPFCVSAIAQSRLPSMIVQ